MPLLRVYPNPWAAFDKTGVPCGICPRDPESDAGGPGRFVGARLDAKHTQVLQDFGKNAAHEIRSPMQRTRYEYMGIASSDPELAEKLAAKDPIELPVTKFYKDRLAEGALIAADPETARLGRVRSPVPAQAYFAARALPRAAAPAPAAPAPEPTPATAAEPAEATSPETSDAVKRSGKTKATKFEENSQ